MGSNQFQEHAAQIAYCNETTAFGKRVPSRVDESSSTKCQFLPNPINAIPMSSGVQFNQTRNALVRTTGASLSTKAEYVGEVFNKYPYDIWCSLMDDRVSRIGILGLGGVGKTEVAKRVNNMFLNVSNKFHHVMWVNVKCDTLSFRHSIYDLQSQISNALGEFLNGVDENIRAAQLYQVLTRKGRCVLILDNVWDYISLREVGVPVGADQCKVVITTRSLQVCRQFGCERRIDILWLNNRESYRLYKKVLGEGTTLSEESEIISKSIAENCGGIPLAVIIMARNMRGITDVQQMRNALNGHTRKKANAEIFRRLRLSYDYLKDPTLQKCFLCCPLFNWDNLEDLMEFLVDEGVIKRMKTRREELDEAYTLVKRLEDICLVCIDEEHKYIEMNEMVREMALQIMQENEQHFMQIRELPDVESWSEDLVRAVLYGNKIEEIPLNYSPSCPKLSTLFLKNISMLRYISDSFFEGFPGLKVLCISKFICISNISIESLPCSLSDLVNLNTLILYFSSKLRKIPSIAKLTALKKLVLGVSGVEELPDGIEMLSKLKYLDLCGSRVKELKSGILANFPHMQFLHLPLSLVIKADELICLNKLESLTCSFIDLAELNKYLMTLKERKQTVKLCVQVGEVISDRLDCTETFYHRFANDLHSDEKYGYFNEWNELGLHKCNVNGLADLENYFQQIMIVKCHVPQSFCDVFPLENAAGLKNFCVKGCDGIEFLFPSTSLAKGIFEKLENIGLLNLKNFTSLFCKERGIPVLMPHRTCFSQLRRFFMKNCPNIKQLFQLDLLASLKNLEVIDVKNCALVEEIFASEGGEYFSSPNLPRLRWLGLTNLPELKRICNVPLICDTLRKINFMRCPKLITGDLQIYYTAPGQSLERVALCEWKKECNFFEPMGGKQHS